ncbi:MAG TPA: hypothetical protein PKL17_08210 [Pseudomonadota bacterium]|nr:hypothetical protein [Pseudomonadota bacterium]HNN54015.1 hypothetical protein [Pseudomonadota bacterium]
MRGDKSRMQSQRLLLAASAASLLFLAQSAAHAEVHLAIGSRFEPYRYTMAQFPNAATAAGDLAVANQSFQTTSLSPYFGAFFSQRYGLVLGLDLGWAKQNTEKQMGANPALTATDSYLQFGLGLGFKMYLREPRKDRIAPYAYVDVFKYFASVSTTNTAVTGDQASAQADTSSPVGGTLAIGAEYFLGTGFSIGAEVFGLRVSHVGAEYTDATMTRRSVGFTELSMYSGLTLNYRFAVGSGSKSDEPEEDRRRTSTPSAPPPPSVPPPTPEAID